MITLSSDRNRHDEYVISVNAGTAEGSVLNRLEEAIRDAIGDANKKQRLLEGINFVRDQYVDMTDEEFVANRLNESHRLVGVLAKRLEGQNRSTILCRSIQHNIEQALYILDGAIFSN